jgi:outer membrane protein OmpA-like peptidoglycan-associated protein
VKKALMTFALAAIPLAASAQDYVPYEGFYIGAGGGAVWSLNNGSNGVSTSTGFIVGGKAGYDFVGPRADLEVGYGRVPNNAFVPGTAINGGSGQLSAMANVYYDFMPASRLTPYIGAGAGIAFIDSNTSLGSTQFAYQGMIGVLYHLDESWIVGLEGRYIGTTNPSINLPNGTTLSYGNSNVAVLAGVAYKFGAPAVALPPPAANPASAPSFMVFFDWDRSNLSQQALNTIKQASDQFKATGKARITATGHTDKSGPENYNMALSLRRANTVKDALVRDGVPAMAISVIGKGETQPLVPTADGVREPQNRRVEIVLQ